MSQKTPIMTVFRRALNKRNRQVVGRVVNATREDGTNYLIARITYNNEFGQEQLPLVRAAIQKDIKKTFDNAAYNPAKVEIVNIELDGTPISRRSIVRTGYVSINVK